MNTNNKKPNPYIERLPLESAPATGRGWGIASFVGTAISGTTDKAVYIESFKEFADEFGKGATNAYKLDSHLAYVVYDFFKCGGSACYIARTIHSGSTLKASGKLTADGTDKLNVTAKDYGEWANGVKVVVSVNADNSERFDIAISNDDGTVDSSYTGVSNDSTSDTYWKNVVADDIYVTFGMNDVLAAGTVTLANGADGLADMTDTDYITALGLLEKEDITWVAIPGETSTNIASALRNFVGNTREGQTFAVLDTPLNATVSALRTFASAQPTDFGACFAPWGIVTDNNTGAQRNVPPCGAVLGNFSASVRGRGIAKTPAGVSNTCDSWIGVSKVFTDKECGILNSANVNCIVPQSGYGICIWGSRVLKENKKQNRKYIAHTHMDIYMDKYLKELTLFTMFETINADLMERTTSVVSAFMTELFNMGCFVGNTPREAYTVVCDWTNNTADGETFNIQVGYAKSKPNEFTLITIKQYRADSVVRKGEA